MTHEAIGQLLVAAILAAGVIASCVLTSAIYQDAKRRNWVTKALLIILATLGIFLTEGPCWPLCVHYGAEWPTDILIAWPAAAVIWAMLFALTATLPQAKREVRQFLFG